MFEVTTMDLKPIDRVRFEAGKLFRGHLPRWYDDNKQLVFEIACSSDFPFEGRIDYARWPVQPLPETIASTSPFSVRAGHFTYAVPEDPTIVAWHLNFSDPHLFVAYKSPLLAQDELQVAEHPILGSVREALLSSGMEAVTVDKSGKPTPVTITGVQRRCIIDTLPNAAIGCPTGLYGNAFARATQVQVKAATKPLSPPTISNILAMAALPGGHGEYSREEILYILITAYTGFSAAKAESERLIPDCSRTVIHTGFWGCGAFGGNRKLMTILQSLAGDLAGVETVFWAFDEDGVKLAREARQWFEDLEKDILSVAILLDRLVEEKFQWGISDGN